MHGMPKPLFVSTSEFFCTQDVSSVYTTNGYLGQMFVIKKISFWEKMGLKFFVLLLVGSGFNAHWICAMLQKLLLASLGQTVGMTFFCFSYMEEQKRQLYIMHKYIWYIQAACGYNKKSLSI